MSAKVRTPLLVFSGQAQCPTAYQFILQFSEAAAPIESLLNLGPKSSQWLREVGISTIAELESLGPVLAYRLVKQRQYKASTNLLRSAPYLACCTRYSALSVRTKIAPSAIA